MKLRKPILIIVFALFLQCGCAQSSGKVETTKQIDTGVLQTNAETIKPDSQLKKSGSSSNDINAITDINDLVRDKIFSWVNSDSWDKIILTSNRIPKEKVEITDKRFLESIHYGYFGLFETLTPVEEPSNGFQPDIDVFTCEFVKGGQSYKVDIVDRGIIK